MSRIQIVVIAAIKQDNKYLLTKRCDPRNKIVHDAWQMPGGGLEFKETLEGCLRREIKEEVGIELEHVKLLPYIYESVKEYKKWHGLVLTFVTKPKERTPKVKLNHEAKAYGWFKFQELKKMRLHFGTLRVLSKVEGLKFWYNKGL